MHDIPIRQYNAFLVPINHVPISLFLFSRNFTIIHISKYFLRVLLYQKYLNLTILFSTENLSQKRAEEPPLTLFFHPFLLWFTYDYHSCKPTCMARPHIHSSGDVHPRFPKNFSKSIFAICSFGTFEFINFAQPLFGVSPVTAISGRKRFIIGSPASNLRAFSRMISRLRPVRCGTYGVQCGVMYTFFCFQSGLSALSGSSSHTSGRAKPFKPAWSQWIHFNVFSPSRQSLPPC